jgi:hypothetical protein
MNGAGNGARKRAKERACVGLESPGEYAMCPDISA